MGIPSYFSNIIKNHDNIVRKVNQESYEHLYLDSNSIIYDSFYAIKGDVNDIESIIIISVIKKIKEYILLIKPKKTLFIAIDGICPLSKMNQQKTRRFKSSYLSFKSNPSSWSTTNITPGTEFMIKLTKELKSCFFDVESNCNIIISSSDIIGEGEQKIFQHIRNFGIECKNDTAIVYGLDADLLMLSFLHINRLKNIFVFREAPDFLKSFIPIVVDIKDPNAPFLLDIKLLSESIIIDMNCPISNKEHLLHDYVFLCFFLGNDFLPHFPSLNIRTHGIQILIDIYRKYLGNYNKRLITKGKIIWKSVAILINNLAMMEHDLILKEYAIRDKYEKRFFPEKTEKEMENSFNNIPLIYRAEENYICPKEEFWEDRYYNTLLGSSSDKNKEEFCKNYFEGLEWVFIYYTNECPDWRWKYNKNYPPLFSDLKRFVSHKDLTFIKMNNKPFSNLEQLIYVLPRSQLNLLPRLIYEKIMNNYLHLYPDKNNAKIVFAFCKYFWEAHVDLPNISIEDLRDIII
jgi:5'-3' exonuclease